MTDSFIDFQVVKHVSDETLREHVAYSTSLGLPEVAQGALKKRRLYIYANGPSAAVAPLNRGSATMALNGSLGLFGPFYRRAGPTYWAACDPGEVVFGFLKHAPHNTVFMPSSKCDRSVVDLLKWKNEDGAPVLLWHIDDAGAEGLTNKTLMPSAISVTISALFLARYMGYKNITIYGWDGCYIDGKDHAVSQDHDHSQDITAEFDGKVFETTNTWLAELEDAATALNMLDINLIIEGPGMMAHVLKPILDHKRAA